MVRAIALLCAHSFESFNFGVGTVRSSLYSKRQYARVAILSVVTVPLVAMMLISIVPVALLVVFLVLLFIITVAVSLILGI